MSLTILYAEDHKVVAQTVKETLESEGWRVVLCFDGAVAIRRLASEASYGLLMFDNHLPNVNGLELVRYARELPHRKQAPIIMLSANECEREAQLAGANEFLMKPRDLSRLVETVARLLAPHSRFKTAQHH
jgi:CheY-like chemotaxis protein